MVEEVEKLKAVVSSLEEKMNMFEKQFPIEEDPLFLQKIMKKGTDKLLEGRNVKLMDSSDEQRRRIRKLEDRLEEAEEEILAIKATLKIEQPVAIKVEEQK